MTREKMTFDMDSFMSGKPTDKRRTIDGQPPGKGGTNAVQKPDKKPMKKYQIRMAETNWNTIKQYCEERQLSISAFIRIAIKEYMDREGI